MLNSQLRGCQLWLLPKRVARWKVADGVGKSILRLAHVRRFSLLTRIHFQILALAVSSSAHALPIQLRVETGSGSDTLRVGDSCSLVFYADSTENLNAISFVWPIIMEFSNGNIIGPLIESENVLYSVQALNVFESSSWNEAYGEATSPDTSLVSFVDFLIPPAPPWNSSGEMWRITFVPLDTGWILIDSIEVPPANHLEVNDGLGRIPFVWSPATFYVASACIISVPGDINADSWVTAADIIGLVNFVFKSGPSPQPCTAAGDMDCSTDITSADIVFVVNYAFKGGLAPCDICAMIEGGSWSCNGVSLPQESISR